MCDLAEGVHQNRLGAADRDQEGDSSCSEVPGGSSYYVVETAPFVQVEGLSCFEVEVARHVRVGGSSCSEAEVLVLVGGSYCGEGLAQG